MKVEVRELLGCLVLVVAEEEITQPLDEAFYSVIEGVAAREGNRNVIVDLGEVNFVDSSFISALFHVRTSFARDGRRLALCNPGSRVKKIFDLASLDTLYDIFDSEDDAAMALCRDQAQI